MTTHARLSPSARVRWMACPASVAACSKYEAEGRSSGPAAIDGTHSHTLLEHCIKNKLPDPQKQVVVPADPHSFIGLVMSDHEGKFCVDKDRADRVKVAVDYIAERIHHFTLQGTPPTVLSETQVNPSALFGRNDMGGTVDVQIRAGSVLEVIDYKDGMAYVPVENNPQLEQYVFGVISENMALPHPRNFETIITTVIQPKLALKGMPSISSEAANAVDFFGDRLRQIIQQAEATDAKDAPFVPGEKQCQYCAHSGNCSAKSKWALEKAGIKFEDMRFAKDAAKQSPDEMTDEQLRELIEAGPILRKAIEAAEEEAMRRIMGGHPVAGLKVVRGVGRRKWAKSDEEVAEALRKMHVPKDEIWVTSLIPITKVEKLTWKNRKGEEKQLSARQMEVLNNELIEKSEGSLTVVPESDRRNSVTLPKFEAVPEAPAVPEVPSWFS